MLRALEDAEEGALLSMRVEAVKMAEDNKALARRIYELLGARNLEGLRALADPDLIDQTAHRGQASGLTGVLDAVRRRFHAFPDMSYRIEEQIAENDKIVTRYSWCGTHRATFRDVAPTGRRVHVLGVEIYHMRGGRVTRVWRLEDDLSLMRQLGVVPMTVTGGAPTV